MTYVISSGKWGPWKVKLGGSVYGLGMFACEVVKVGAADRTTVFPSGPVPGEES